MCFNVLPSFFTAYLCVLFNNYLYFPTDHRVVILGGKQYLVGRRDCDILVANDATVSRKHAEISMTHPEANLVTPSFVF